MRYYCIRYGMSFPDVRTLIADNCPSGGFFSKQQVYEDGEMRLDVENGKVKNESGKLKAMFRFLISHS